MKESTQPIDRGCNQSKLIEVWLLRWGSPASGPVGLRFSCVTRCRPRAVRPLASGFNPPRLRGYPLSPWRRGTRQSMRDVV